MKTKTKIVTGMIVVVLGVSSLSAQMMNDCPYKSKANIHNGNMKGPHSMQRVHKGIMPFLFKLNLSDEQEAKIQKIIKEYKQNMPSPYSAFKADDFDKDAYIKQAMTKKENMIKLRATMISQIHKVLTDKQKSQMRVLMDLKEEKMKEGCRFDKNSYGRR